jgi:hypothetical protein
MVIEPRRVEPRNADILDDVLSAIEANMVSIKSFGDISEGYRPAALPDFYTHTSRSLLKYLGIVQRHRPAEEDTPRNRNKEYEIMARLGRVLSRGTSLELLAEQGIDINSIQAIELLAEQDIDINSTHARWVNALFTCANDLWMLAGRYKGSREYSSDIRRSDTVRISPPKSPMDEKKRNATTVGYRPSDS